MKTSRLLFTFTTLILSFLFTVTVQTATTGNNKPGGAAQADPRILIDSVDASASTVAFKYIDKGTTHTYTVDGITMVKVNDTTGTFAQIKPGMQVRDSVELYPQTLDSISVRAADPAPAGAGAGDGPTKQKKQKNAPADGSSDSNN